MLMPGKNKQTIALQTVLFLFLFSAVIFVLMFLVNSYMSHKIMKLNAKQKAESLAWESIYRIEGILSNVEMSNTGVAFSLSNEFISPRHLMQLLAERYKNNNTVQAITMAFDPEYLKHRTDIESLVYSHINDITSIHKLSVLPKDYMLEDWYIIPAAKRMGYWSEPWVDVSISPNPITTYSFPIIRENKVIGIIRTDLSLHLLQNIVSSIHMLKSGYATLISGNGTYVTHPADSLVLNYTIFSLAEHYKVPGLREVGQDLLHGGSNFVKIKFPIHKYARWMYYAPIKFNKWGIAVVFRDDEIMSDYNKVNIVFSLILGIGLLLILASIYFRITTILRPLNALIKAVRKVGSGDFNVQLPQTHMDNEVSLLTNSFSKMQAELKNYMDNLVQTTREKDKISAEVLFAAQIQQNIIPSDKNFLTEVKEISIFGVLEPAEIIGGDLYDAFMVDEKHLCFVIADVFGKGIVASMLMTMIQTLIRAQSKYASTSESLVRAVNLYLCENNKQANFVTMLVGILDLQTGTVDYCNAGHTPIYVRKSTRQCIRFSETHCTALGIFHDLKIESSTLQLDAQDFIILFTDGVTEAMSENEAFFGYQRFEEIICSMQNPTPEGIVKAILQDVRSFTKRENQTDDLSILVLKFNHPKLS
jgi:sigma-B regulation protein RsbU (phosphoserine phosphatase)